ncbi:serine hydrolase domain-containing protein [Occultella kanbiaonis]|uniref:serine hydrolase domain-containing protein n=1 Tax=Occultella kanbiaonis TaxID=2675754 RepID=UPI0012B7ADDD|nr:serine hydrolase domain-containing protein [Occultella kanbiaonis]
MAPDGQVVSAGAQHRLWPFVERVLRAFDVPGIAVGLVADGELAAARGFGVRDRTTSEPVTEDSMFHLASVSKPFVAVAMLQLAERGQVDLDAPVLTYLPYFRVLGGHTEAITVRHLLTHTAGIPDVEDYRWHEPEHDDGALERFVRSVAASTSERAPGGEVHYCNTGYEIAGDIIAKVGGRSFEDHLRTRVLIPAGMTRSTFIPREVPGRLATAPHLGVPAAVLPGVYPYHRGHAPSSTLHSSVVELSRFATTLLDGDSLISRLTRDRMWQRQTSVDWSDIADGVGTGWFLGGYRGRVLVGHEGEDPGFTAYLGLVPELRGAVVLLANSNSVPLATLTRAALDVLLGEGVDEFEVPTTPITVPVGAVLAEHGVFAAIAEYRRLADDPTYDASPDVFMDAAWAAIEVYRSDTVRPLLETWTRVQPDSAQAWEATGWADLHEGDREAATTHLRRALSLDPGAEDAARLLRRAERG